MSQQATNIRWMIWRERKTLLAGWLVAGLIWRERKTLLPAG